MCDETSLTVKLLAGAGLFCDLLGAFLLSIPMIWSSQKAGATFTRIAARMKPSTPPSAMVNTILFAILFSPAILHVLVPTSLHDEPLTTAARFISYFMMCYVLIWVLFNVLSEALPLLGRGNNDKRIGGCGLVLLGAGFLFQFIVNVKWVT
jgi:hypothetical protein